VLTAFHRETGRLHPSVQRQIEGRRINQTPKSTPHQPYSVGEWHRLSQALEKTIADAQDRHRRAMDAAGHGRDPRSNAPTYDNLAWLMTRMGPVCCLELRDEHRLNVPRELHTQVLVDLFPTSLTAYAYVTTFAMRTGIVPDGVDSMTIDSLQRTSKTGMIVDYHKGRSGPESLNAPRDAVRLLDQWVDHSALLREHAGPKADRLWLHVGDKAISKISIYSAPRRQDVRRRWADAAGIIADDGTPLTVQGGRVRTTYHQMRDRSAWTGRTTIDPNHSARIEGDHYLSTHTQSQRDAVDGIIEQAQQEVLLKREPAIIHDGDDAARFAQRFPELVKDAQLDREAVAQLLAGEQDVFVAACGNPMSSPYAPTGVLCPARPWVCLLCPLAAFSPRHLPNLLRLKHYFTEQARSMTTTEFMSVFGPYLLRLSDEILPRFPDEMVNAIADRISAKESPHELPLTVEELPQ